MQQPSLKIVAWIIIGSTCGWSLALASSGEETKSEVFSSDRSKLCHERGSPAADEGLQGDDLDAAELKYRNILEAEPDDRMALLGLSKTCMKKAKRDGKYPAGWQELLDKLEKAVAQDQAAAEEAAASKLIDKTPQLPQVEKQEPMLYQRERPQLFGNHEAILIAQKIHSY